MMLKHLPHAPMASACAPSHLVKLYYLIFNNTRADYYSKHCLTHSYLNTLTPKCLFRLLTVFDFKITIKHEIVKVMVQNHPKTKVAFGMIRDQCPFKAKFTIVFRKRTIFAK